jgi:hypothetical protein
MPSPPPPPCPAVAGMLYCMEFLAANLDWLQEQLQPLVESNHYFIFDCPGQVELFTGQEAFKQVGGVCLYLTGVGGERGGGCWCARGGGG